MQLSNVAVSSKTCHPSPLLTPSPYERSPSYGAESQTPRVPLPMAQYQPSPGTVPSSFKPMRLETIGPNLVPHYQTTTPSGLSLLLANRRVELPSPSSRESGLPGSLESSLSPVPQPCNEPIDLSTPPPPVRALPRMPEGPSSQISEEAPLLAHNMDHRVPYSSVEACLSNPPSKSRFRTRLVSASQAACTRSGDLLMTCVRSLPAVLLGVLLNILDGVSCELLREYPMIQSLTGGVGQMA